jgi:hypothetical protein
VPEGLVFCGLLTEVDAGRKPEGQVGNRAWHASIKQNALSMTRQRDSAMMAKTVLWP